nr:voltage-dependent calcium channel subunit alpha-2/delta-3-like isoform X2 [Onthophagus taurus]
MMRSKEAAISRVKTYAEYLGLNRDKLTSPMEKYEFYDSTTLQEIITPDEKYGEPEDIDNCNDLINLLDNLSNPKLSNKERKFYEQNLVKHVLYYNKPINYTHILDLDYDPHFDENVNVTFSVIRTVTNVYGREKRALNNIRWSEALDSIFRCNYKNDRSLTWQYFASSAGFMRLYPGIKWSDEEYDVSFDWRMRSWFTEAMASPKDMIILMDSSGSMRGERRIIANIILHDILDSLSDNDYVNVYTFNNSTMPLVHCFNDTLVQANEENLRLIRESIPNYIARFPGNLEIGFEKAFELLKMDGKRDLLGDKVKCNKAIMVITEGLDYYDESSHEKLAKLNTPDELGCKIRIFTFQLGTDESDAQTMQKIACDNLGYYVNVSKVEEVREKVVKYITVMSRSINFNKTLNQPIWSALYVDLTDRRLTNWLWSKEQGLKQREVFITQGNATRDTNVYAPYAIPRNYSYLTTVSLPVYDKRKNMATLLGVAAVDVPTTYLRKLTKEYLLGVNGYAFIITNNGYVLMHPDHRTKFKKILKPTFNRVDLTEVELSPHTKSDRNFDDRIIKLRERIVMQEIGQENLTVMTHMDEMRRIFFGRRLYFYTPLEPYSLIIALPEKYGLLRVQYTNQALENACGNIRALLTSGALTMTDWVVHPDWLYFKDQSDDPDSAKRLTNYIENCVHSKRGKCKNDDYYELLCTFLQDFENTKWFATKIPNADRKLEEKFGSLYTNVTVAFLATHSGLTRWKNIAAKNEDENHFSKTHNKTVDEMWYKRTVEENYNDTDTDSFIFSTPLDIEEFNDTEILVTVTNAIFKKGPVGKVPVAVVGYEIMYQGWKDLYENLRCGDYQTDLPNHPNWTCLVLDNHGYALYSPNDSSVGLLILDINKNLTHRLEEDGVFESVTVFDYQGICFPRLNSSKLCPPSGYKKNCRQTKHPRTLKFESLIIPKTIPTPCDKEIRLYRYKDKDYQHFPTRSEIIENCSCPYVSRNIKNTNLVLIFYSTNCCEPRIRMELNETYPQEVLYKLYGNVTNIALPCYIQHYNNFNKRAYINSVQIHSEEYRSNLDCGQTHKQAKDEL